MKLLLTITAYIEGATGLALVVLPSIVVSVLLGVSLTEPGGILLGRIGGAALITVAISCWLMKDEGTSAKALIKALIFYNGAAALLLVYAGVVQHFSGIGLWPAVVLHSVLLAWGVKLLAV